MLAEAAEADAAEDERLGEARGDELPAELADPRSRRERLRRCKEQLEQAQADEQAAYEANLAWRAAWEAEHGRRARRVASRRRPIPARSRRAKINTTDPDTRLMKRAGGSSVQGYNAQVVASPEQVIIAAAGDAVAQRRRPARADGRAGQPRRCARPASRSRSGSCSPTAATGTRPRSARCAGRESTCWSPPRTAGAPRRASSHPAKATRHERIEAVLSNTEGQALYRRRQQIVEPVFAHTKVHPAQRPLPPPRPRRLPGRVAADRRHPQPAQALACRAGGADGLIASAVCRHFTASRRPSTRLHPQAAALFARQPQ